MMKLSMIIRNENSNKLMEVFTCYFMKIIY